MCRCLRICTTWTFISVGKSVAGYSKRNKISPDPTPSDSWRGEPCVTFMHYGVEAEEGANRKMKAQIVRLKNSIT